MQTIINIIDEVASHKAYCAKWGITEEELAVTTESASTTAYGAYLLDIGLQGRSRIASLLLASGECG